MRQVLAFMVLVVVASASVPGLGPTPVPTNVLRIQLDPDGVLASARTGSVELVLPTGAIRFELAPRAIAEGAVIGVDGKAVGVAPEVRTFSGTALGHPAVLAATRLGVFAIIVAPDPVVLQPAWVSGGAYGSDHVAAWGSTVPRTARAHAEPLAGGVPGPSPEPTELPPVPVDRTAMFLLEADAAFFDRSNPNGECPDCWVELQQALLLIAWALYEPQTGIDFEISSQWICTTVSACPYVVIGGLAESDQYLSAFQVRWETRSEEPPHHLGHLFSGTNFAGAITGLAYEASVNTPRAYAVSEFGVITADLSLATHATLAHEVGHNFDGQHSEALPWTIMWPNPGAKATFTDGTLLASKNNVAHIVNHALQQLPS